MSNQYNKQFPIFVITKLALGPKQKGGKKKNKSKSKAMIYKDINVIIAQVVQYAVDYVIYVILVSKGTLYNDNNNIITK